MVFLPRFDEKKGKLSKKPKLIISNAGKGQPIYYMCSNCLREFPLPEDQPPKDAVRELFTSFKEHVEQIHPEPSSARLRPAWGGPEPGSDSP